MSQRLVGLDFGGTAIKAGAATANGQVLEELSQPIALEAGPERVLDQAAEMARALGATTRVGIGCAGLIDRRAGVLLASPNLSQLVGTNLSRGIAERLGLSPEHVLLENDANVAALGEQRAGAANDLRDFLMVTLGTGIGGGLVLGGELYAGSGGMAGEVGHMLLYPDGKRPPASAGSLEKCASATAARRRATERGLPADDPGNLERLSARARAGEQPEAELLFEIGADLGRGLSYAEAILDLRHYLFGGGFAAALDVLAPGIHSGMEERRFGQRKPELRAASLGGSAGWIGAAFLGSRAEPN